MRNKRSHPLSLSLSSFFVSSKIHNFSVDDTNMNLNINPKTYKLVNLSTIIAFYVFHMTS